MKRRPAAILLAAAVAATPPALGADTLNLPARKPGLWELSTTIERPKATDVQPAEPGAKPKPPPSIGAQMCLDAATDGELMDYTLKLSEGNCRSLTSKREGKSHVIDAQCTFRGRETKLKIVITGDFQSAYTMRTEGTMDGGSKGLQAMLTTQIATWKSTDCPNMKPGDIALFGGVKVNIKQLKALSGLIR